MTQPNEPCRSSDPVHEEGGQWYFWEETWADRQGPFGSEEQARESLRRYARWLETGVYDMPATTQGTLTREGD